FAEASETCCSSIIWSSVAKPCGRSHSGGTPYFVCTTARCSSAAASSRQAFASVRSVNDLGFMIANLQPYFSRSEPRVVTTAFQHLRSTICDLSFVLCFLCDSWLKKKITTNNTKSAKEDHTKSTKTESGNRKMRKNDRTEPSIRRRSRTSTVNDQSLYS